MKTKNITARHRKELIRWTAWRKSHISTRHIQLLKKKEKKIAYTCSKKKKRYATIFEAVLHIQLLKKKKKNRAHVFKKKKKRYATIFETVLRLFRGSFAAVLRHFCGRLAPGRRDLSGGNDDRARRTQNHSTDFCLGWQQFPLCTCYFSLSLSMSMK